MKPLLPTNHQLQTANTNWKAAGVAIPVFSLRSENSSGIGEFSDIKKLVDWAYTTKQKVIQVLPINDTTMTYTGADASPYSAITIYGLHPIYLGLHDYPLKNEELKQKYRTEAFKLNNLPEVDYEKVMKLKVAYLQDLFAEIGQHTLEDKDFLAYYAKNEEWLFPYACFSYLRDFYKIADISKWRAHRTYDKKELEVLIASDPNAKHAVELTYFTQYLLHKQLSEVKKYVNQHGIALKGDIPIGVSRNSVDVWTHPHLFNLDTQTGAPPDDFSITGQNWEFPTYNWEEMEKDGYRWWIKRFRKMADYFDAYRIDHLLGFFRIWEIPASSIHSTLGYFSPALPLSVDEINEFGIKFDEEKMAKPYIDQQLLEAVFGEHAQEVIAKYLNKASLKCFELKEEYNTQVKIRENFGDVLDAEALMVREGLYSLCSQVLFVRDKRQTDKFHPRICGNKSNAYKNLSDDEKLAFDLLYEDFYEHRHTEFWRDQALKKLPALISSTEMLACGEDLGMVPNSVPSVMKELKLLSLEIERMPKTPKVPFENLAKLPYLSVCATSSHDTTPIRAWWLESKENTQIYYNEVLGKKGLAPKECTTEICSQILANHLNSPSMLAVFPLQDWMSIDVNVRRANPADDRINKPGSADGCWRYRMHVTLEELVKEEGLNKKIVTLVEKSGRA